MNLKRGPKIERFEDIQINGCYLAILKSVLKANSLIEPHQYQYIIQVTDKRNVYVGVHRVIIAPYLVLDEPWFECTFHMDGCFSMGVYEFHELTEEDSAMIALARL